MRHRGRRVVPEQRRKLMTRQLLRLRKAGDTAARQTRAMLRSMETHEGGRLRLSVPRTRGVGPTLARRSTDTSDTRREFPARAGMNWPRAGVERRYKSTKRLKRLSNSAVVVTRP